MHVYMYNTHCKKKLSSSDKDHLDSYTIPLLSPGMVSLVHTLPEYSSSCNSFKACTHVYVNRARLFCDLLLSPNKTSGYKGLPPLFGPQKPITNVDI